MIGGMRETQEMMDICGKHNITCDIEVIRPDNINEAMDRLVRNDVRYRFVIDIAGNSSNQMCSSLASSLFPCVLVCLFLWVCTSIII